MSQAAPVSSILCVPSGVMVSGDSEVAAFERVFSAQTNALLQEPVEVGLSVILRSNLLNCTQKGPPTHRARARLR